MTDHITRSVLAESQQVVVLLHGDGLVEVFGTRQVEVTVVNVPYVGTIEGQKLSQEYVETTLPMRAKEIFWPNNLRASGIARPLLPSDIARRKAGLAMLQILDHIEDRGPDEPPADVIAEDPAIPPKPIRRIPGKSPAIRAANRRAIKHRRDARRPRR